MAVTYDRNVDWTFHPIAQVPKARRAGMAQKGVRSASEERRRLAAKWNIDPRTNRVDGLVDVYQPLVCVQPGRGRVTDTTRSWFRVMWPR